MDTGEICLFCEEPIDDQGLAFYDHVENEPTCEYRWQTWMRRIPEDHGGA